MTAIDHIDIRPEQFGWQIWIYGTATDPVDQPKVAPLVFGIGDAIQFHDEVERTIGRWLADGPADFHTADSTEPIYVREDTDHGR